MTGIMEAGRVIGGKYRLRREIGKGAMGSVWAAIHESLGRAVAVKFLRPSGLNPDTAAARFVAEARMAAAVKHRFVVDIFDFGLTEDGASYMVLELLEGEELGERMYYGPPVPVIDAVRFIGQCLGGLSAVHDAGIVHRDLKPENIFMMQDGDGMFPKLLDFGISKRADGDGQLEGVSLRPPRMGGGRPTQLTQPGTVIGTPWYMAPEQLRGRRDLDTRADIYGMGIILWEWLTGRVPYDDDNIGDLVINMMSAGPPDLTAVRPELGERLARVLQRAMALRREDRFQSAQEMRDALQQVLPELPTAWTVVQKSIASLSSKEVLGVAFPSEAPTERTTRALRPDGDRRGDATQAASAPVLSDTLVLSQPPRDTAPRPAVSEVSTADSPPLHPLIERLLGGVKGLVSQAEAWPPAQHALELCRRFPGYMVAAAMSVFVIISFALFFARQPGDGSASSATDTFAQGAFLPSAEAQDAAPRKAATQPTELDDSDTRTLSTSLLDAGMDEGDAGARASGHDTSAKPPLRRVGQRPKDKPARLIRDLDF